MALSLIEREIPVAGAAREHYTKIASRASFTKILRVEGRSTQERRP